MLNARSGVEAFVRPGEVVWSDNQIRITTVLGSCVAVCAWHPIRCHGGMAHGMLPSRLGPTTGRLDGRYMDEGLAILLKQMQRFDAPSGYQIKLFGGSVSGGGEGAMEIGRRNAERARELIEEHGLLLAAADLGGPRFRKLAFDLKTGDVWLKRMSAPTPSAGVRR